MLQASLGASQGPVTCGRAKLPWFKSTGRTPLVRGRLPHCLLLPQGALWSTDPHILHPWAPWARASPCGEIELLSPWFGESGVGGRLLCTGPRPCLLMPFFP